MAEPGGGSLPAVSHSDCVGELGSVGVLWRPPPPLWRPDWAWLRSASAGLGEAVSAPGPVRGTVSRLFRRKKPSAQILKGAGGLRPEGGVERPGSRDSTDYSLRSKGPNVGI